MVLSQRFQDGLDYACVVHAGQVRKGTEIPYVSHLLAVTSIALEHGANQDEAIAALLHDAAEDAGGKARLEDIRIRFGDAVAEIVDGCTDTDVMPKPPWRERKEQYIAHVAGVSPSTLLVSASDKLHNARSILSDLRQMGDKLWDRFRGGKDGTLWYYRSLVQAFQERQAHPRLIEELDRVVTEIEKLANS
ncbi:MAG: HD domain-containing protein [bacterium]|nr:HD domain-containing protein [bacterium]